MKKNTTLYALGLFFRHQMEIYLSQFRFQKYLYMYLSVTFLKPDVTNILN